MVGDGTVGRPSAAPWCGAHGAARPGRTALLSADPVVPPRIDHRYDSEAGDVAALQRVRLARELARSDTQLGEPMVDVAASVRHGTDGPDRGSGAVVDPGAGSVASRDCGWSTDRSCRGSPAAARTPRS